MVVQVHGWSWRLVSNLSMLDLITMPVWTCTVHVYPLWNELMIDDTKDILRPRIWCVYAAAAPRGAHAAACGSIGLPIAISTSLYLLI